jgi:hypothetical protein
LAWGAAAIVGIRLAAGADESCGAVAEKVVDEVGAGALVKARVWHAFVDVNALCLAST